MVATNETHSVKEFCEETFGLLGLDWAEIREARPALRAAGGGGPADRRSRRRPRKQLGWEPKVRFKELVKIMVDHDLELAKREAQIAKLPKP